MLLRSGRQLVERCARSARRTQDISRGASRDPSHSRSDSGAHTDEPDGDPSPSPEEIPSMGVLWSSAAEPDIEVGEVHHDPRRRHQNLEADYQAAERTWSLSEEAGQRGEDGSSAGTLFNQLTGQEAGQSARGSIPATSSVSTSFEMCSRCGHVSRRKWVFLASVAMVSALGGIVAYQRLLSREPALVPRSGRAETTTRWSLSVAGESRGERVWGRGPPSFADGRTGPLDAPAASATRIVMDSFVCRAVGVRLQCYSPSRNQCVLLRDGRDEKPEAVMAVRGGTSPFEECASREVFTEM